jgi:hypothetical protein
MIERHCDVPGCGRLITGNELLRQRRLIEVPGIPQPFTVSVTVTGNKPDVCDCCLLDAIAKLDPRADNGKVITLPSRKSPTQKPQSGARE